MDRIHGILSGEEREGDGVLLQADGGAAHIRPPEGLRRRNGHSRIRREHRARVRRDRQRHREPVRGRRPREVEGPPQGHEGRRHGPPVLRGGRLRRRDRRGRQAHRHRRIRARGRRPQRRPQGRDGDRDARRSARHGPHPGPLLPGRGIRHRRDIRMGGLPAPDPRRKIREQAPEAGARPERALRPHGEGLGCGAQEHPAGGSRRCGARRRLRLRRRPDQQEAPVLGRRRRVRRHDRMRRILPHGVQRGREGGREALDVLRGRPSRPGRVRGPRIAHRGRAQRGDREGRAHLPEHDRRRPGEGREGARPRHRIRGGVPVSGDDRRRPERCPRCTRTRSWSSWSPAAWTPS